MEKPSMPHDLLLKKSPIQQKEIFTAPHSGILNNKPSLFAALGLT
jgi:hypothetical protein